MRPSPWVVEVMRLQRPPTQEEVCWIFQQLTAVMKLEDEFALRQLQQKLALTLGEVD
jgi:hypothetical protein